MEKKGILSINKFINKLTTINRERLEDESWNFNEEQRKAIKHGTGPLWITAGPGSGKTEVLVSRVLKLILVDGVHPESILITTFTEKAAQSLEERIVDRFSAFNVDDSELDVNDIYVGTLHSICDEVMNDFRYPAYVDRELLDEFGQELFMYNNSDLVDLIHTRSDIDPEEWETIESGNEIDNMWSFFESLYRGKYPPNRWESTYIASTILNRASQYRVDTGKMKASDNLYEKIIAEGLEKYRKTLRENSRCDFARVLEDFIEFLDHNTGKKFLKGNAGENGLEYVLVDEYQDTNPLQEELYFKMCEQMRKPNITIVGDDDQSLYRFRGGTVECLINFPERAKKRFEESVEKIQLKENYRSIEDIVSWFNRYIIEFPAMDEEGARAEGKEPMKANVTETGDPTGVRAILEENHHQTGEIVAELVKLMKETGYIEDYSQIALLFNTTKESQNINAGPYVRQLRARGISVHNPRNKIYLEREEISFLLGTIIRCIDPKRVYKLKGNLKDSISNWYDGFDDISQEYEAERLREFVEIKQDKILSLDKGEKLDVSILELVYQIMSFEPFSRWIETSEYPDRADRLAKFTSLLENFSRVSGQRLLKKSSWLDSVSKKFLDDFYWGFCGYMHENDLDDPEDLHDQIPEGSVQIMTVHQAKGLEFPVVFVDNLDWEPKEESSTYWIEDLFRDYSNINPVGSNHDRAVRDLTRQFYVAFSRAEKDLILIGKEEDPSFHSLGYDSEGKELDIDFFDDCRRISDPSKFIKEKQGVICDYSNIKLRNRYSITGDVLSYRLCKKQYGFFNEIGFIPSYEALWSYGRLVHDTLDRAHRHYQGDIEGVEGGEIPSDKDIENYFNDVISAMRAQNIYQLGGEAAERALENIKRFNRREGEDLYPKVKDTEHRLQATKDNFIMKGVVDVLIDGDSVEIWDYKASKRPEDDASRYSDYDAQIKTYAELYRKKNGEYPDRGVICFLGEEDSENSKYIIDIDPEDVSGFIDKFESTVEEIESEREERQWLKINPDEAPPEDICGSCSLRWGCEAREDKYNLL
ncbi:DNA helicase UvrD fused to PD-(D/E)XK superfamily nuclease [Methanonatronarchaeum thermophilum]|uniref:DNA 3'-5' helicase n=1 Tax=Methanonatronarchaeum thermophilum TaxID=1927129 RepID=A0A1Y3GHB6_9EURY|nr:ATP-dependent DNA helicase [Methanonatronarchaeum thermophilum]OUJ18776.1 DNA helicase UvrD fused to PD-(D/E)XK superfamily nuclease [Methanonatronarchaeum thermophilum]